MSLLETIDTTFNRFGNNDAGLEGFALWIGAFTVWLQRTGQMPAKGEPKFDWITLERAYRAGYLAGKRTPRPTRGHRTREVT